MMDMQERGKIRGKIIKQPFVLLFGYSVKQRAIAMRNDKNQKNESAD